MKKAERPPIGQKTQSEKEKLLVTSNFSFSDSVFKSFIQQTRQNKDLFGKGLNDIVSRMPKIKKNKRNSIVQGPYSPTILKNILCLFLQDSRIGMKHNF